MTELTRQLDGEARTPHELLAEVRPHDRAPADRPFVYVNMVATVDGRAALAGSTRALGSEADTLLLSELRALADAVLIGSGTVRAEGYGRLVGRPERLARRRAAGQADTPVAVLLSRSLDLPWDAGLFAAADQPVLIYTGEGGAPATGETRADAALPRGAPATSGVGASQTGETGTDAALPPDLAAPVELVRLPDPSPAAALADLRARGVRALLCEGGPTLNRALFAAGVVDELFLTLAPLVSADDAQLRIVEGAALPDPARLSLLWVLRRDDELFLRYAVHHGD